MRATLVVAIVLTGGTAGAADYPGPVEADVVLKDFRFATGEFPDKLKKAIMSGLDIPDIDINDGRAQVFRQGVWRCQANHVPVALPYTASCEVRIEHAE